MALIRGIFNKLGYLVCKFCVNLTFHIWVEGGTCNRVNCDVYSKAVGCYNFGNTNKCIILQSMYCFCCLAATRFGTVAILRVLTPRYHQNTQQYTIFIKTYICFVQNKCMFIALLKSQQIYVY